MSQAPGSLLVVDDLRVAYDQSILALDGVSLRVPEGAIVALLGPNGAGKSTLLKAIAGMLPFERGAIRAGGIAFAGRPLAGLHPATVTRRGVALVQEGRAIFRNLPVAENLRAAALLRPSQAAETLKLVYAYFPPLERHRGRLAGYLSGGEAQMLAIGMAIMLRPRLLLLDEPSLGLAPLIVEGVFAAVRRLHDEVGTTLLIAEQTVPKLLAFSDWAYVLGKGQLLREGPPASLGDDALHAAYLGAAGGATADHTT